MTSEPQVRLWLGAPCSGGLALPDAHPTASHLYGPRGVYLDDRYFIVADTGNHRVLIWHGLPDHDHASADIVLGQQDFFTEGPNARGAGPARGLHMPCSVAVHDGNLIVADAWNHRLLIYDGVPQSNYAAPVLVLGQDDFTTIDCNRGGPRRGNTFNWPFGFLVTTSHWYVTDTGNRRVLAWRGDPFDGREADFVLGQADLEGGEENRGGPASASSLRWPHAAVLFEDQLWIADAGNHRVLGWPSSVEADSPASSVLGQRDFVSNQEFVMARQSAQTMRFPYGLAATPHWLAVADTANNRILGFETHVGSQAAWVLGQPDFKSNGENHWKAVTHQTLCWPYGLAAHGDLLAIADSGNNRVVLWRVPTAPTQPLKEEFELCV